MKSKLLLLVLALMSFAPCSASFRHKKEVSAATADTVGVERGLWRSVFKKSDLMQSAARHSDLSLYLYDGKLYAELPVRNFGHHFLVSTTIAQSNIPTLLGNIGNEPQVVVFCRADTLVTFTRPGACYRVNGADSAVTRAIAQANTNAVFRTAPIKAWAKDSASVLFEIGDYLKATNKDAFDPKGLGYANGVTISGCTVKGNLSFWNDVRAYGKCVCVEQTVGGTLSLSFLSGTLSEKPKLQATLQTLIAMLPDGDKMMAPREASPCVGSGYVSYNDYRNLEDTRKGYYATRRRFALGDTITFYVDTLLAPSWRAAVARAAEGWNGAFSKSGLGAPIALRQFPKDSAFSALDPMLNVVMFANNGSQVVAFDATVDPRTGEILGSRILVPRELADNVRRYGITKMAEVDSRYRSYDLPDDLMCEILQANMLKAFGMALGLRTNLAGSAAYSVAQLRSPEFTQEHGITASAMDGQIYNYAAMPGDREKGVVLTVDRPGASDEFAIKYLYTPGADGDSLKAWVRSHAGDARYFYGKPSPRVASDPRCQANDMSSDPMTAALNLMHHFRYTALHSPEWFDVDTLPDDFRILFPEYIINDYSYLAQTVSNFIGGVYQDEFIDGTQTRVTRSVPKSTQRRAVHELLYDLSDMSWLTANPKFFNNASPANDVSGWMVRQLYGLKLILFRLQRMDMSVAHSADPYTQAMLIDDLTDYYFRNVRSGRRPTGRDIFEMNALASLLISMSQPLSAMAKERQGSGNALATEATEAMGATTVKYFESSDLSPLILEKLGVMRKLLVRAKALASGMDKDKVQFTILAIDRVLK